MMKKFGKLDADSFAKEFKNQFDSCVCGETKMKVQKCCLYCERLKSHPRYGKEIIFR